MNTEQLKARMAQLPIPDYSEHVTTVKKLKTFLENFSDDAKVWITGRYSTKELEVFMYVLEHDNPNE